MDYLSKKSVKFDKNSKICYNLYVLIKGGTMKKVNKLSLLLASLGVFLIALAGILQYEAYELKIDNQVTYDKVTVKDMMEGHLEDTKKTASSTKDDSKTDTENLNPTTEVVEEVKVQDELEEVNIYSDVTTVPVEPIVYDNLTMQQLADKLNRSLNSTISGKGYLIASYSLSLGIDPYLSTAIILHETGCSGTCSSLVQKCNNVGGQKGGPSCGGGAYKAYPTLDEGIMGYIDNLYNNYYSKGLTTAEAMGPKYAASTTWASQVNNYIMKVRNK